jgi:DNA replication protein DnaC
MGMANPYGTFKWIDAQPCLLAIATSGVELHPAFGISGNRQMQARTMLKFIGDFPFVVFDDIGIKAASDTMNDALLEVIKARGDKPTIYTSNLSPEALANVYDDRVVDRLCSGFVLEFKGESLRTGI